MKLSLLLLVFLPLFLLSSCKTVNTPFFYSTHTAKEYEQFIEKNAPNEDAFVAVQLLAEPDINNKDWDKAVEVFRKFKPRFPNMQYRFYKIIAILNSPIENLKIKNFGQSINTPFNEYCPVISADCNTLYFIGSDLKDRSNRRGAFGGEDIFVSKKINGVWQIDQALPSPINTIYNEAVCDISTDGNQIILFGQYEGNYGFGDLFYSEKTADGWSDIKHFPSPINTQYFDCDGKMTSDGKAIIFTSDRPGGVGAYVPKRSFYHGNYWGNTDIYICLKTSTGWSEPINLGRTINTPFAERSPFLHPDGKTLYFCSDGHNGLGKLDVYKSVRLNDSSWTEWSEPVNLGKEINSSSDDWGYIISTDGKYAFFNAYNRSDGKGGEDIYSITLPEIAKPEPVATIQGVLKDDENHFIEAELVWEDLSSKKEVGRLKTSPVDGSYFIVLPLGKKYGYYAEKPGYFPISNYVDLTTKNVASSQNVEIKLYKKERIIEKSIVINNIFFDLDKDSLKAESFLELDRLVGFLNEIPSAIVEISGHTDNKGTEQHNNDLSLRRAESVVNYLIGKGILTNRLKAIGYGKSKPKVANDTEENKAINRRVEFKVIK